VKANQGAAGVDGQTIADFEANLSNNLYELWNRLSSGSYFPLPVRRVDIPKVDGGSRPLGIPTVADRVAQEVVRRYLEPRLEPVFHADSYGYRPGKSAIDAVRQNPGITTAKNSDARSVTRSTSGAMRSPPFWRATMKPSPSLFTAAVLKALANGRRLEILNWLKDPRAHFPPQADGDLVKDGVCGVFIAQKLKVSPPTASEHLRILTHAGTSSAVPSVHTDCERGTEWHRK
jgi:hypothetical protein